MIQYLEQIPNLHVHPLPNKFDNVECGPNKYSALFYFGLRYQKPKDNKNAANEFDITPSIVKFEQERIDTWKERKPAMLKPVVSIVKRDQIPKFVCSDEKRKELAKQLQNLKRKKKPLEAPKQKIQRVSQQTAIAKAADGTQTVLVNSATVASDVATAVAPEDQQAKKVLMFQPSNPNGPARRPKPQYQLVQEEEEDVIGLQAKKPNTIPMLVQPAKPSDAGAQQQVLMRLDANKQQSSAK